jgi:hypothetical protein
LHLLEVGLRWLPDTFLCWKLEGLTACGMEVTVASRAVFEDDARLRGVELIRIPPPAPPLREVVRVLARDGLALLVSAPRCLVRVVRGGQCSRS